MSRRPLMMCPTPTPTPPPPAPEPDPIPFGPPWWDPRHLCRGVGSAGDRDSLEFFATEPEPALRRLSGESVDEDEFGGKSDGDAGQEQAWDVDEVEVEVEEEYMIISECRDEMTRKRKRKRKRKKDRRYTPNTKAKRRRQRRPKRRKRGLEGKRKKLFNRSRETKNK